MVMKALNHRKYIAPLLRGLDLLATVRIGCPYTSKSPISTYPVAFSKNLTFLIIFPPLYYQKEKSVLAQGTDKPKPKDHALNQIGLCTIQVHAY